MTKRIGIRDGQALVGVDRRFAFVLLVGVSTSCSPDQVVGRNAAGSSVGGNSTGLGIQDSDRQQSSAGGGATSSDGVESSGGTARRVSSGGTASQRNGTSAVGGTTEGGNSPSAGGRVNSDGTNTELGISGSAGASTNVRTNVPTMIGAGMWMTCALIDGGVKCWGRNEYGQLGNGSTANGYMPTQVQGLVANANAMAVGAYHACAVVRGGAYCWGSSGWSSTSSALGNNSTADSAVPVPVAGLSAGVTSISAGWGFSCAIVNGQATCWGDNTWGQLGSGNTSGTVAPVPVQGLTSGVTAISAGNGTACAIVNGGAMCWGENSSGKLGDGTLIDSTVPVPVQGLTSGVTAITVGLFNTCAVANGAAYCWGWNELGAAPDDFAYYWEFAKSELTSTVPVQVSGLSTGVTAMALGEDTTCALVDEGAKCWGFNRYGGLGDPDVNGATSVPVPVQGLSSGVTALTAGYRHNCAIADERVKCWGSNWAGALGIASVEQSATPVQPEGF